LDDNLSKLQPISTFGREVINAYYSENLPEIISVKDTGSLNQIIAAWEADLSRDDVAVRASKDLIVRFIAALQAKRFLILTGLAGSGKTKLAQAFAQWITPSENATNGSASCYALVPVGADWTGSENILGYPNGLDSKNYVTKPALELILHAEFNPSIPHFLILDEMNLSHVERYFADVLSAIESEEAISLYQDTARTSDGKTIPKSVCLPQNLFVIGTVNVDETTYMFSPKVLDRANVIEFRMDAAELTAFLESPKKPNLNVLNGRGMSFGSDFVIAASDKGRLIPNVIKAGFANEMALFFDLLHQHNAEFGYRTSYEAARLIHFYKALGEHPESDITWFKDAMDSVIVQKLLPKLHGSRAKMGPLLKKLWFLCTDIRTFAEDGEKAANSQLYADRLAKAHEAAMSTDKAHEPSEAASQTANYRLSANKIARMWRLLNENGFASFAEA